MAKRDLLGALGQSLGSGRGSNPLFGMLLESMTSSEGEMNLPEALQSATQGGAGGVSDTSTLDKLQMTGDVVGAVDPTPTVDLINAAVSGYRAFKEPERRQEHLRNVAISTVSGMVPYLGDTAKLLKYGKFGKAAKGTNAAADTAKMSDIPPVISDAGESPFAHQLEAVEPPSGPIPQVPFPESAADFTADDERAMWDRIASGSQTPPVGPPESPIADAGGGRSWNIPNLPTGGGGGGQSPQGQPGGNQPVPPMSSDFLVDLIQGFGAGAVVGGGLGMLSPAPFQSQGNSRGLLGTFGTQQQEAVTAEAGEMAGGFWKDFKTMVNPLSSATDKLKAAFDGLWKATIELPGAIEDWGESLKESQRHLTRFHAGIAGTYARSEVRGVLRSLESGERTAGTTEGMVEALDDLKDVVQPIKDTVTNVFQLMSTTLVRLMVLQIGGITKAYELMKKLPGGDAVAAMEKFLEEIARNTDKAGSAGSQGAKLMSIIGMTEEKLNKEPGRRKIRTRRAGLD